MAIPAKQSDTAVVRGSVLGAPALRPRRTIVFGGNGAQTLTWTVPVDCFLLFIVAVVGGEWILSRDGKVVANMTPTPPAFFPSVLCGSNNSSISPQLNLELKQGEVLILTLNTANWGYLVIEPL